MTLDQFKAGFRKPAEIQVKLRLALEKIAELENIEVDDAALEAEYAKLAEEHKMDVEKVKSVISAESLAKDIKAEKAFDLVKETAEVTETEAKD